MLKRKIFDKLIDWKQSENHKPLIVEGMRQVGKTFIIDYFGKNNFKNYVYINFTTNKEYKEIFNGPLDINTIKSKIKLFKEFNKIDFDHDCLIFLDEIQDCTNAISALKSFHNCKELFVIGSGSYLGFKYNSDSFFPVGYINFLKMNPLDFEEFLWANNISNDVINELHNKFNKQEKIIDLVHNQMVDLFRRYICIGGMPEVVNEYINTLDIFKARNVQKNLINAFYVDVTKYAKNTEKQKIIECFNSIPQQLAKENKKFIFSQVKKNARSAWYYSAINWLIDSNIANKSINVLNLEQPLNAYEENDNFKLYMSDTGLLMSMLDDVVVKQIMNDENFIYKGAIYENIVAQMLVANDYKLRFYSRNYTLEIDYIIAKNDCIYPIEVKAGNNYSKSLSTIIKENEKMNGIKLSNSNILKKDRRTIIPWYLLFLF